MSVPAVLRSPLLHVALRLLLGMVFVAAALPKIADPAAFARIVYQWQALPPVPANVLAIVLPWVELLAGLMLFAGVWRQDAALVVALLLVMFLGAAAFVLASGIDVEDCGCTSVAAADHGDGSWPPAWTRGVGWFLVTRNLVLLAVALIVALLEPRGGDVVKSPAGSAA